jgi:hypothetical protein
MSKATRATIRARVEEVYAIRLDGAGIVDIRQYVAEKEAAGEAPWVVPEGGKPVSERTLWRYVLASDKLMAADLRHTRKRRRRLHLAQRRALYAKAVAAGDYKAALSVLRDLAELEALYPPRKIAPTNPRGDQPYEGAAPSDAERAAAIVALFARVGRPVPRPDGGGAASRPLAGGGGADRLGARPAPLFPPGR